MKFNAKVEGKTVVENFEGGKAYIPREELELFLRVASNFVKEDKFYQSGDQHFKETLEAFEKAIKKDPEYVAKLVVFARENFFLRTLPTLGTVILANHEAYKGTGIPRKVGERVFTRPDMLTEALATQFNLFGKRPIPNSLKKALRNSIIRFDTYQLAKYRCDRCEVKLKDVVLLTHPKPRDREQEEAFKKLIEGKLKNTRTWEAKVSTQGSTTETWNEVLDEFIKYKQVFALLRNLRNLIQHEVDEEKFRKAMKILPDPKEMKRAKVYPFRYYTAYKMLERVEPENTKQSRLLSVAKNAIREALNRSYVMLPEFKGDNVIFVDVSGSMDARLSGKSSVSLKEVASLYGSLIAKKTGGELVAFADRYKFIPTDGDVIDVANKILWAGVGYATYAYKPMEKLIEERKHIDRLFIFTDMVVYDEGSGNRFVRAVNKYREEINPDMRVITLDLAGYGQVYLNDNDTRNIFIGGFNEKILDIVPYLEQGNGIVDVIKESVQF